MSEKDSEVRKATPKDIPQILRLYESGLRELGETDTKEEFLLRKIVNSYHLAPCFLLIIHGKIVGMAGFTVMTSSHNGVASMIDYMFFIEEEHRKLKNLSALVNAAKHFASETKMSIKIEFFTNNDEELRKRLLKMHGFRVVSVCGVYNPEGEK